MATPEIRLPAGSPGPVRFAAAELRRCLLRMTELDVKLREEDKLEPASNSILVAERERLSHLIPEEKCPTSDLDDEILISQKDGCCIVTGSNPRSVLFAAYELLERLGARFVGPGYLGELLPRCDASDIFKVQASHRASYRHRGVCIEGAPSIDHCLSMIDWMAKRKMNTFFLQFKTSLYFWRSYYSREYNPRFGKPEEIDVEKSLELDDRVIEALKLRGMVLHKVGHGWTAEAIGFPGLGWYKAEREPDEKTRQLLALVGGKREFHGGIPINTELCYSNPEAFERVVGEVVRYAEEHPEVDCLHFWLSDSTNNFCECPSCKRLGPSDWYVRLVREAARRIAERGLKTRLVFLCYSNTLTAPKSERFGDEKNRLLFMFAPISRCYAHGLNDPSCKGSGQAGGWAYNQISPPRTNMEYVQIRKAWYKAFDGDGFVFDYYLWMPYHRELNPIGFARLINKDVGALSALKLNGLVSCQTLRAFYPTGLLMESMARSLWNSETDLEQIVDGYLSACFGRSYPLVRSYLEELDRVLTLPQGHSGALRAEDAKAAQEVLDFAERSIASLDSAQAENPTEKRFLDLMRHFNKLISLRARVVLAASGDTKRAEEAKEQARSFLCETEELTHPYLDTWLELRAV